MKIMLVERNEAVSYLYIEIFAHYGHEVVACRHNANLLKAIALQRPGIVILGVSISGANESDLIYLRNIKAAFPNLLVIFNTSLTNLHEKALAAGADYLDKKTGDFSGIIKIISELECGQRKYS